MSNRAPSVFISTFPRGLRPVGFALALVIAAACGGDDDLEPTGGETGGSGGSGGSTTGSGGTGGRGGSTTGTGGSATGGSGGTTGSDASAGKAGSGAGDGGVTPDGGTSGYVFPLTLTPLTPPSTSTSNISLYVSVTDKNGVGVAGLPSTVQRPPDPNNPFAWVAREGTMDIDPKESGFTVTPPSGNTLDMPTVLLLDLSGSITVPNPDGKSLLDRLRPAAKTIIGAMLPEQRMALVTFAGSSKVRVPFTTDKVLLQAEVDKILTGDGQSTNLYGAMIDSFGMWQDGFVSAGGAKLTAGLVIVVTDGKDNAGLKTLSATIAARQNRRVVSVGIFDPAYPDSIDSDAMTQLATTGTFVKVDGNVDEQVGRITSAMSTLGRSIYVANYCTPKLGGTDHTFLFTVQGNTTTTTTTTAACTPATFPSNHPSLCAQLDPKYTQACGYTKGNTTNYTCCTATAPYTCPNDTNCYTTAEAAAAKCGSAGAGASSACIRCGGTGMGASQDTGLLAGTAIRVKFNATNYQAGQCPLFWGPTCKAVQACCQGLTDPQATNCNTQLLAALGNEMTCQNLSNQYCGNGGDGGGADSSADRMDSGADRVETGGPGFPPPPPPSL